jgi:hypothetical protein
MEIDVVMGDEILKMFVKPHHTLGLVIKTIAHEPKRNIYFHDCLLTNLNSTLCDYKIRDGAVLKIE